MSVFSWLRPLAARLKRTSVRRIPQRPSFRPCLEALEDRLTPSAGLLDPTFGSGGVVTSTLTNSYDDRAFAVLAQPDGKIVATGHDFVLYSPTKDDFLVARYNPDGSLDSGFGSGGHTVTDFNGFNDEAVAAALQPQSDGTNKILAAGYVGTRKGGDFGLARYNANGTLDTTFGTKGKVETDLGGNDAVTGMVVQPDGKVIVVGYTDAPGSTVAALVRYNANGTLDTTFGSGGKVVTSIRLTFDSASVALQSQADGSFKIVLAGQTFLTVGSTNEFPLFAARYNASGTIDSTFGSGGVDRPQRPLHGPGRPDRRKNRGHRVKRDDPPATESVSRGPLYRER